MAISSILVKQWYKDLSVKDLEEKYYELKKDYYFNTKDEQIKYIIDNYLNASHNTNTNSTKVGIEELLKEKTGKQYKLEEKAFDITRNDIIEYLSKTSLSKFKPSTMIKFFQSLNNKEYFGEEDIFEFLIAIAQNKSLFDSFIEQIDNVKNSDEILNTYFNKVEEFVSNNRRIG